MELSRVQVDNHTQVRTTSRTPKKGEHTLMSAYLKLLAEKRQNVWAQAKNVLDTAELEKRSLNADEQAGFDRASSEMDALATQIRSIDAAEKSAAETDEILTRTLGVGNTGGFTAPVETKDESAQLRSFLQNLRKGGSFEMDIATTGDSARVARAALRSGKSVDEQRASGVLNKTTNTQGQNLVQTSLYDQLVQHLVISSSLLTAGATVLETAGAAPISIPVTTTHGAAGIVGENVSIATVSTDPAFGQRPLGGYKYGQLVQVSRELLDDELFDIIPYIAQATGRNIGIALGAHLIAGTGSSQPTGIVGTGATSVAGRTAAQQGTGATVGGFTGDDLVNLQYKVLAPYRASPACAWVVADSTLGAIRQMKDGAGRYLFDAGPAFGSGFAGVGAPDTLLGKPIYTDPGVAAIGASNVSVIFGDISRYFVRLAGGVRFERSDDFAFGTDLITFKAVLRADGVLVDQTGKAVVYLTGAAT
jgi:HK97 family phage major capsid protein